MAMTICTGQTHKMNTTYSSVVKAGQDVGRRAVVKTSGFNNCEVGFIGRKAVSDHIMQSRPSMGVASMHD